MATIASLAIKVSANIADLSKGINSINSSIGYMVKTAKNASPSLKSLEDAAKGAGAVMDAVAAAQKRVNDNPVDLESQMVLTKTQEAAAKLKTELNRIGEGVSGDILKMTPTISNLQKAQQMVQQLKDTFGETSPIVAEAQANVGKLATETAKTQMQMAGLKSVIYSMNNLPFAVFAAVLKDMWDYITGIGSDFNKYFSGIPGVILKVSAVAAALIVVIGLMNTQMLTLNGSVTYFSSLWAGSMIIQGITGFAALLPVITAGIVSAATATWGWFAAQTAVNQALIVSGIGAVLAGIGAAIAGIIWLVQGLFSYFSTGTSEADKMKQKIEAMEKSTEAFRDRIGEAADKYKELNNAAKQYHDANQTGAQKYLAELQKIDEVMNRESVAGSAMGAINQKNNELVRALEKAKAENKKDSNADLIKSIEQQIKDLEGDRVNLAKEMQNSPSMDAADGAAAKKDAYQKMLESLGVVKSDAEKFAEMSEQLEAAKKHLSEADYKRAAEAVNKLDPAVKERLEAEKKGTDELKRQTQERKLLAEKFIDLGKTEQDKYNEMLAQLESVKNMMSPAQYAKSLSALQQQEPIIKKQNEELKKQIDEQKKLAEKEKQAREQMIDKFRQMANDSPVAKFNELKTQLESVRNSLSRTDFAAAMNKLDSDLANGLGIKEFLKPEQSPAEKLADVYKKLEEYADKINDPFFDLSAAKQRAADKFSKDEKKKDKPEQQVKNAALERGSAAYLAMVNNANNPQLQEQKRQTKLQQQIADNTKQQGEKLEITQTA